MAEVRKKYNSDEWDKLTDVDINKMIMERDLQKVLN